MHTHTQFIFLKQETIMSIIIPKSMFRTRILYFAKVRISSIQVLHKLKTKHDEPHNDSASFHFMTSFIFVYFLQKLVIGVDPNLTVFFKALTGYL